MYIFFNLLILESYNGNDCESSQEEFEDSR